MTDAAHVRIGDTIVKLASEAKYLGIIFNRKLSFHQHIQHATKKGTQFTLTMARIANCTRGPTYQQIHTLLTSVVTPRMNYAATMWYRPFIGNIALL